MLCDFVEVLHSRDRAAHNPDFRPVDQPRALDGRPDFDVCASFLAYSKNGVCFVHFNCAVASRILEANADDGHTSLAGLSVNAQDLCEYDDFGEG